MKTFAISLAAFSIFTASGCDRPAQARSGGGDGGDGGEKTPIALKVDSILPSGEALRRFQSELPRVSELSGAASSRDELVARFIGAIENGDTAALGTMHVSKAEYGFLYFPSSVYSRKPYELPPDIAWLLSEQNSRKGFTRVTRRLGGKPLDFNGYECSSAVTEGENRFWRTCRVTYIDPASGRPVTKGLFGAIMERGGSYKFLSYANDF